jgi:hypothetical protein
MHRLIKSWLNVIATSALLVGSTAVCETAYGATLSSSEKLEIRVDSKKLDEDSQILWNRFGGFCQIAEWQPVVLSCTEGKEEGAFYRTLSLQGGGKIKEKLLKTGPLSYHYAIVEAPLPVKNYEANFSVAPGDGAVDIIWSATYDAAEGKSDADARAAIDGIFRAGIASIKTKLPDGMNGPENGSAPK